MYLLPCAVDLIIDLTSFFDLGNDKTTYHHRK